MDSGNEQVQAKQEVPRWNRQVRKSRYRPSPNWNQKQEVLSELRLLQFLHQTHVGRQMDKILLLGTKTE